MTARCVALAIAIGSLTLNANAGDNTAVHYRASLVANASTGDLAPYMIGSWNSGRITGASGIWQDGHIFKTLDTDRRFSWSAGFEYIAGYGSAADYARFTDGTWEKNANRQSPARIIQLYGQLKYRSVFMLAGMKEHKSGIVDNELSSGDLTRSNNARPIPGVSVGFLDFQNIPFTNGWVQIDGELMYGRFTDSSFRKNTFNYYSGLIGTSNWYTYKRCYFRTKPTMPLSVTIGMQAAGEFAGQAKFYRRGEVSRKFYRGFQFKDIIDMFFPIEGSGEDYYKGSSLGSWDVKALYRFKNGSNLTAYFEGPWEDGSGIGRQNGWDGLWGIQYDFKPGLPVSKIVLEYFDFTNQSGPIHYAPHDTPGSSITDVATGGDNYYNNDFYGPYCNYGMSIGSPFVVSPLYNTDGMPGYCHNRARGFHAAVAGALSSQWTYTAKASYQHAGGTGRIPAIRRLHDTSALIGIRWTAPGRLRGLEVDARLAFDYGNLRGNNFGAMVGVSYSGNISSAKK